MPSETRLRWISRHVQIHDNYCFLTCIQMVINAYNPAGFVTQDHLADQLGPTDWDPTSYGSNQEKIYLLKKYGIKGKPRDMRDQHPLTFQRVVDCINNQQPIIIGAGNHDCLIVGYRIDAGVVPRSEEVILLNPNEYASEPEYKRWADLAGYATAVVIESRLDYQDRPRPAA